MSFNIKEFNIPTRPGCYLYKDGKGEIVYVGKAKNLRNRVKSYFVNKNHDSKTNLLVSKIRDVEFITTNTEVEALLLEQTLIHKNQPKFNIDLKGSVRYAYIKITNDKYPRIITSRSVEKNGIYFGPYTDGTMRRHVIGTLIKIFKIRTCVTLPKKVCLQYHIGNCIGPCQKYISQEDYMVNIRNAEKLLKGQTKEIVDDLQVRMKEASKTQKFELAKSYRDQIHAIQHIQDRTAVNAPKSYNQDVVNWIVNKNRIYFQVFNILKGVITSRHNFNFEYREGIVEEFVEHYYSISYIPEEIILPEKLADQDVIVEYLRRLKQEKFAFSYVPKVDLTVPQKGHKLELLNLAKDNIEVSMGIEPGILELQKKMQMQVAPIIIDFFDISNLGNQYIVGATVQLKNGQYNKSAYQKFKIKSVQAQDDFASMKEVVYRRYNFLLNNQRQLPDLICIDGGRGQLNAAIQALAQLHLNLPICSLAKQEEEIYMPNLPAPIKLDQHLPGIKILIKGRDEVHRFVITYNRKLRKGIFK